jgi:hypothetical protein
MYVCMYVYVYVGFYFPILMYAMKVGPCHHGMARPRVADGGTASDMEDSCE